jgi:RNA polymerase sigma-70 factor (ECF subfamily)
MRVGRTMSSTDGAAAPVCSVAAAAPPLAARSDAELMAALAHGDQRALGELYDRFAPVAYGLALRVLRDRGLAEDAVQEAFLSVWRSAARFDSRRGSVRGWVLILVHRRAVDLVQRNQRHREQTHEQTDEQTGKHLGPSAAEVTELDAERRKVQAALAALPAKQRTALELAYYGGCTQKEIAARLDLPVGTVKSQTFDALRRLRQLLLEPSENGWEAAAADRGELHASGLSIVDAF